MQLGDKDVLRNKCGLPISPYFMAPKLKWAIDHLKDVRKAIKDVSFYMIRNKFHQAFIILTKRNTNIINIYS